jgi:hypothetical protein
MKDIFAYLTGWNGWLIARLQAAQRGEPNRRRHGHCIYISL